MLGLHAVAGVASPERGEHRGVGGGVLEVADHHVERGGEFLGLRTVLNAGYSPMSFFAKDFAKYFYLAELLSLVDLSLVWGVVGFATRSMTGVGGAAVGSARRWMWGGVVGVGGRERGETVGRRGGRRREREEGV